MTQIGNDGAPGRVHTVFRLLHVVGAASVVYLIALGIGYLAGRRAEPHPTWDLYSQEYSQLEVRILPQAGRVDIRLHSPYGWSRELQLLDHRDSSATWLRDLPVEIVCHPLGGGARVVEERSLSSRLPKTPEEVGNETVRYVRGEAIHRFWQLTTFGHATEEILGVLTAYPLGYRWGHWPNSIENPGVLDSLIAKEEFGWSDSFQESLKRLALRRLVLETLMVEAIPSSEDSIPAPHAVRLARECARAWTDILDAANRDQGRSLDPWLRDLRRANYGEYASVIERLRDSGIVASDGHAYASDFMSVLELERELELHGHWGFMADSLTAGGPPDYTCSVGEYSTPAGHEYQVESTYGMRWLTVAYNERLAAVVTTDRIQDALMPAGWPYK
jgi:hypothetical protein